MTAGGLAPVGQPEAPDPPDVAKVFEQAIEQAIMTALGVASSGQGARLSRGPDAEGQRAPSHSAETHQAQGTQSPSGSDSSGSSCTLM